MTTNNARENLGPQFKALYHGTPEGFKPGDVILPASKVKKNPSADGDIAYASPDFGVAHFMAWEQNNHNGANFEEDATPPERVYRVEPADSSETLGIKANIMNPVFRPDLPSGYGTPREVTSKQGFRVVSEVQDPNAVTEKMHKVLWPKRAAFEAAESRKKWGITDEAQSEHLANLRRLTGKNYASTKSRTKMFGDAIGKSPLAEAAGQYGIDTRKLKG
jgi:hypothetical protein